VLDVDGAQDLLVCIYAGIEFRAGTQDAKDLYEFLKVKKVAKNVRFSDSSGYGIKPTSQEGSQRLMKAAIEYALSLVRVCIDVVVAVMIVRDTIGMFVFVYVSLCLCGCVCFLVHICVCLCLCLSLSVCLSLCPCLCIRVCAYICLCVCVCPCLSAWMCLCLCAWMCVL
jgi:hypothetical protein